MLRSTCPCFCSLFCFLWPISLGCPFFFLMPSSSFPSATCKRTEAACCTSNATVRLVAPLAWQQRRQDTGSYLPMGSCVCLCVFGRDLTVFIPLVFVGKEKVTGGCFYIVLSKRKYDSLCFKYSTPEDSLSLTYISIQGNSSKHFKIAPHRICQFRYTYSLEWAT